MSKLSTRLARDDYSDLTADDCIRFVGALLQNLPPDEATAFYQGICSMADAGEQARGAADLAMDARRRQHYATDSSPFRPRRVPTSAARRNFAARFPSASRIG
jgi:hypothetical protein